MLHRSFPAIPSLKIYTDEGEPAGDNRRLPPDSMRYQVVEAFIHLALCLLESREGRASLATVAKKIIHERNFGKKRVPHLYNRPMEEMPQWIDHFLRAMRSNFPMTYLTKMEGEALAVRQSGVNDMTGFDPKICGYIDINRTIVNNMIFCRQERNSGRNYTLFKFQMGISIAHEIVHFLTGFLTGELADCYHTPVDVVLPPYGKGYQGEAGRYWESILLGGVAEFYYNKADPIGSRQAGTPYLFDDGFNRSPARLISMSYIDNFVRGSFTFPIGVSRTRHTTRAALRQRYTEMTHVRWPARNPPRTTSPSREEASGSAYRRLPSQYLMGGGNESRCSSYKGFRRPSD